MKQDVRKRASWSGLHFDVLSGLLRATDLLLLIASGLIADLFYLDRWPVAREYAFVIITGALLASAFQNYLGIYRPEALYSPLRQTVRFMLGIIAAFLVLAALGFATRSSSAFSRGWVAIWLALAGTSYLLTRLLLLLILKRGRDSGWLVRNFVIIGSGEIAERFIARFLQSENSYNMIVGIFHDSISGAPASIGGIPVLGPVSGLRDFAQVARIDEIVIALPLTEEPRLIEIIEEARLIAADVRLIAVDLAFEYSRRPMTQVAGIPMLNLADRPVSKWNSIIKALEDRLVAGALLLIFAVPMAIIGILIKLDDPGPALFRQKRFGLNGRLFGLYKFRTMYVGLADDGGAQQTHKNDVRVTRVGNHLRQWSLDELPQLFNVLKGDMSLVGPRPHAVASKIGDLPFEAVVSRYAARHRIKPGMTGLAQVKGWRGEADTVEKIRMRVKYDLEYIEKWSLLLDCKILAQTFWVVLMRKNAY